MHGETASRNLMGSSVSGYHHPYINTHNSPHRSQSTGVPYMHTSGRVFSVLRSSSSSSRADSSMGADRGSSVQFHDFLPLMARKLGVEGLIQELCKGFQLLMDPGTGRITFQSLKRNSARLGLGELRDEELMEMMREGDMDGDGVLDQMEFCILMVRLSPELMEEEAHRMFEH